MMASHSLALAPVAAALALFAAFTPAGASLVAVGPEIRVDGGASGFAGCPLVAGGSNGSFEVTWATREVAPRDSHPLSRHFSWQGLPTEPQRTLATSSAFPADLVGLPGGGYRGLWTTNSVTGSLGIWWTTKLSEFGEPVTPWRRLRTLAYGSVLSIRPTGGFVAAELHHRQGVILLHLFDASGRKVGGERRLSTTELESPRKIGFVHRPDGGFLAFWSGIRHNSDGTGESVLFTRAYSSAGEPVGGENVIASVPAEPLGVAGHAGSVLPDGRIAFAWHSDYYGVQTLYLQILSPAGVPMAPPAIVAEGDIEYAGVYLQGVAVNLAGEIAVLWLRETEVCPDSDFQCDHLFARVYDGSGASLGEPVAVDTPAAEPYDKAFCGSLTAAGASFVASWAAVDADGSFRYVVFARRLALTTP